MKQFSFLILFLAVSHGSFAQYDFQETLKVECTEVKNQARTGTCWSFATASFIESELIRTGKGTHNLSEMFVVRNIYKDKARNYMLRQGKANFSQGALAHDLMNIMSKQGIVPESVYSGLLEGEERHNHSEMEAGLKGFLDGVLSQKRLSTKWPAAFEAILTEYIGSAPATFEYEGKSYTPKSFAKEMGINSTDYVNLTSFSHHPFHSTFILEIPDNYSNGSFYNVPLDDMMASIDKALQNGFSISWDGDVSEKSFSSKNGMAILPEDLKREDLFENPGKEVRVSQENRQKHFESFSTTDDHLMHIVGKAQDKAGNEYYIIKNSWGETGPVDGYLYMSKAYARMKTVSVLMHKDAIK